MKRKAFIFTLLVVLIVTGLSSCNKSKGPVDIHNSKISLSWEGVYTGTIPSASGMGIDVSLKLNSDNTYELTYDYVGKPDTVTNKGAFTWDDTGNVIIIDIVEAPNYYRVAQNKLIQLDMEGNMITGDLADDYVLMKN